MKLNSGLSALALLALLAACSERELILPGERLDPRDVLDEGAVATAPENRSEPVSLPAQLANADWPLRGGNAQHYVQHPALGATLQQVWSADIGAANSRKRRISASPVVADGRVFTLDSEAGVTAVSTAGARLWSVDLTPPSDRSTDGSGGGLGFGGGRLFVTTGFGELVALDPATGAVAWRQKFGAPVTGAPTVVDGTVYVVARDGSAWAVDASTGRERWQVAGTPSSAGMLGSAAPAVAGGNVLFPFGNDEVIAVARDTGTPVWRAIATGNRLGRASAGVVQDVTGDPVVVGGVTYYGTQSGRTVAVDTATGARIWTAREGAYGPVWPVGGALFLVNDQAKLVRLDAGTGETVWSVEMPYFVKEKPKRLKSIYAHYGPVLAGGRLIVASSDGLLRSFDPVSGALLSATEISGGSSTQPVVAGGTLYLVSTRGQLLAFR